MTRRPTIVVDDAIAWAPEAFAPMGEVIAVPGAAIDRARVADADALVVRTVTRVDASLVAGSRLTFVGTATAGIDHVDTDALARAGIRFASAAGCNAHAVVDYVTTALHLLALERDPSLLAGPVAIVGFGNVGRRLAARLRALGAEVRVCDPPLARRRAAGTLDAADPWARLAIDEPLCSLGDAVDGARVLTVHVPLSTDGADATVGLVDASVLARLGSCPVVFNTSRGSVVDEGAVRTLLENTDARAVLDVWTGEPAFDAALALHPGVRLATPHIAGYTLEGKVAGTAMIARALAEHLGQPEAGSTWRGDAILGPIEPVELADGPTALARITATLRRINPIERDDGHLRALARDPARTPAAFEALRRGYHWRRALSHHCTDDLDLCAAGLSARRSDAVVLIAHGSPDPDWRRPLDAIAEVLRRRAPHRSIVLAFLDHLEPSLATAVAELERGGCTAIRVVSVFLSAGGGHIKRDVPALCARVAADHPGVRLQLLPGAIGGEHDVIDAIAGAIARITA